MKKKNIIILIILTIVIFLVALFLDKKVINNSKIEVLDTTYNCASGIETFYEDDNYTYTFSCYKSSYVYVKFENGDKILVKEALNDKKVTIKELEKAGLEFTKNEK